MRGEHKHGIVFFFLVQFETSTTMEVIRSDPAEYIYDGAVMTLCILNPKAMDQKKTFHAAQPFEGAGFEA